MDGAAEEILMMSLLDCCRSLKRPKTSNGTIIHASRGTKCSHLIHVPNHLMKILQPRPFVSKGAISDAMEEATNGNHVLTFMKTLIKYVLGLL